MKIGKGERVLGIATDQVRAMMIATAVAVGESVSEKES